MLTKDKVIGIVKKALDVTAVDENSSMDSVPEWDSLGHLNILLALDAATDGAAADLAELAAAGSVKAILEVLDSRSLLSK